MKFVMFVILVLGISAFTTYLMKTKNEKFEKYEEERDKVPIYENVECGLHLKTFISNLPPPGVRFSLYDDFIVLSNTKVVYYDDLYSIGFEQGIFFEKIRIVYGKKVRGLKITVDVLIEDGQEAFEIIKKKFDKINN